MMKVEGVVPVYGSWKYISGSDPSGDQSSTSEMCRIFVGKRLQMDITNGPAVGQQGKDS